jgi:superfamily II DNA or RNA helicase
MPLTETIWLERYASNRNDLYGEFYERAIAGSNSYDRAVAYFRSSILVLSGAAWADFAERGGKIRIACAPELTAGDIESIAAGEDAREIVAESVISVLNQLRASDCHDIAQLLSSLVALDVLDFRFLVPRGNLFHEKTGIFSDSAGNAISFVGSANETWNAWSPIGNHEAFEVFTSWSANASRVEAHQAMFDRLWLGSEPEISTYDLTSAIRDEIIRTAGDDPMEDVRRFSVRDGEARGSINVADSAAPRSLLDYQRECIENWHASGERGVVRFATGAGKTVTALAAVREWTASGRPALILVPSRLLLEQWSKEARIDLPSSTRMLLVGGGHTEWKKPGVLLSFLRNESQASPRVVIAILASASTRAFMGQALNSRDLLIVCDEVHNIGSPDYRRLLSVPSKARLGLSATPERFGDAEGTALIREFFGDDLAPQIEIRDAIARGRLCPYDYFVSTVDLVDEEAERYQRLTDEIISRSAQHRDDDARRQDDLLKRLLIARARIIKGASAKPAEIARVVASRITGDQRWLVYCEDFHQLVATRQELAALGIESDQYHTRMPGDPIATLRRFERDGGVLVSIRCLDEGIDIPSITHAVIAASSKNPRQFIQRRGRVLRASPDTGKSRAEIHDILVIPTSDGAISKQAIDRLVIGEVERGRLFATDADNEVGRVRLRQIIDSFGIDLDTAAPVSAGEE